MVNLFQGKTVFTTTNEGTVPLKCERQPLLIPAKITLKLQRSCNFKQR